MNKLLELFRPRAEFVAAPVPAAPITVQVPPPALRSEVMLTRLVGVEGSPVSVDPPDGFELAGWTVKDSSGGPIVLLLWTR